MIDSALLMRRAIRLACDQHGLAPDTLHLLPSDARFKFQELCLVIADDMRYKKHMNYTLKHFVERTKIYNNEKFPFKIYKIGLKNDSNN